MLIHKVIIGVVNVGVWILMGYVAWIVFKRVKKVFKDLKKGQSGNKNNQQSLSSLLESLDTVDSSGADSQLQKEESDNSPEIELLPQ